VTFRRAFATADLRDAAPLLHSVDVNSKHAAFMRRGAFPRHHRRIQCGEANA
jgi:hypothetical protein